MSQRFPPAHFRKGGVGRVLASVIGVALEGDRLYAAITLGVLAILLISVVGLR